MCHGDGLRAKRRNRHCPAITLELAAYRADIIFPEVADVILILLCYDKANIITLGHPCKSLIPPLDPPSRKVFR